MYFFRHIISFRGSIVASILACHARDPGSIPGSGVKIIFCLLWLRAFFLLLKPFSFFFLRFFAAFFLAHFSSWKLFLIATWATSMLSCPHPPLSHARLPFRSLVQFFFFRRVVFFRQSLLELCAPVPGSLRLQPQASGRRWSRTVSAYLPAVWLRLARAVRAGRAQAHQEEG